MVRIVKFERKHLDAIFKFEVFRNLEGSKQRVNAHTKKLEDFKNAESIKKFYGVDGLLDCCLGLVALNKGEVIGLVFGWPVWSRYLRSKKTDRKDWRDLFKQDGRNLKREFSLTEVAVKKDFRDKGVGEALVKRFVSEVKKKKRYKYIGFSTENPALIKVFKKVGLTLIPNNVKDKGNWKRYYFRV